MLNTQQVTFDFAEQAMNIGKTLKLLRTAAEMSQRELARRLGVTASYLSLVEGDRRRPSLPFLESIAGQFRIPAGFLLLQDVDLGELKPSHRKLIEEIRHDLLNCIAMGLGRGPRKTSTGVVESSGRLKR